MVQQINLHIPVLLAPRQRFSARAVGLALMLLAALLTLACAAVWWVAQDTARQDQGNLSRQAQERGQLQQALARAKLRHDPAALAREQQALQLEVERLRQLLGQQDQGQLPPGDSHAAAMALFARTVPEGTWITRLNLGPRQLVVEGVSADPAALRQWIDRLAQAPQFNPTSPIQLRVEQRGLPHQGLATAAPTEALQPGPLPAVPAWAFRLTAERALARPESRP